jgi:hypothetical protein
VKTDRKRRQGMQTTCYCCPSSLTLSASPDCAGHPIPPCTGSPVPFPFAEADLSPRACLRAVPFPRYSTLQQAGGHCGGTRAGALLTASLFRHWTSKLPSKQCQCHTSCCVTHTARIQRGASLAAMTTRKAPDARPGAGLCEQSGMCCVHRAGLLAGGSIIRLTIREGEKDNKVE